jgi:hypothetical protein
MQGFRPIVATLKGIDEEIGCYCDGYRVNEISKNVLH